MLDILARQQVPLRGDDADDSGNMINKPITPMHGTEVNTRISIRNKRNASLRRSGH